MNQKKGLKEGRHLISPRESQREIDKNNSPELEID